MEPNGRLYNFVGRIRYAGNKSYRVIGTVYGIDEVDAKTNVVNSFLDKPDLFEIVRLEPRPDDRIISMITTAADE